MSFWGGFEKRATTSAKEWHDYYSDVAKKSGSSKHINEAKKYMSSSPSTQKAWANKMYMWNGKGKFPEFKG